MIDLYFNEYIICIIHFEMCWNPTHSHNIKLIPIYTKPMSTDFLYEKKRRKSLIFENLV
jgi:hypothetical protein